MELSSKQVYEIDNLFVGSRDYIRSLPVTVASGENVLKRGCLMTYDAATKKVKACKLKADVVFGVLAQDVDATSEDVEAVVYLNGDFDKAKLSMGTPGDGGTVDDFFLSALNVGILFREAI